MGCWGVSGDQYLKETGTNSEVTFLLQQESIKYLLYFSWANLGTDTISGPSVTECKMLKIRPVLHLICWTYEEIKLLLYILSKRPFDSLKWKKLDLKSSTVLWNVSLFVGAPVRVYLHGLVRRLLYSHLTPSTLSSPSLPPSSVLQCTFILTLRLLLPHCSMGEYAWCYDRCMSAALPWKTPQIESLSSLCLFGSLRLGDAVTSRF